MEVRVLSTPQETLSALDVLSGESESVRIAAAFVRHGGIRELQLVNRPIPQLQVLAGTDFGLTQIEALEALNSPPARECKLYYAQEESDEGVFHPKLYIGQSGADFLAVVGSSNLTRAALTKNVELNVLLKGKVDETIAREITGYFQRLWSTPTAVPLTREVVSAYRVDQAARERLWRQMRHSPEFRKARELVQSAVLEIATQPGRKWLLITSEENYVRCRGRGRWGDENYKRISQIRPGDILIFYIKGVHKLGAVTVATTPVYESSEHTWTDREYPYRVDFAVLADPPAPLDFRPFIPRMSFFPRKDEKWGTALQTSSLEIPESDAKVLIDAISVSQNVPQLGLRVAEQVTPYQAEEG